MAHSTPINPELFADFLRPVVPNKPAPEPVDKPTFSQADIDQAYADGQLAGEQSLHSAQQADHYRTCQNLLSKIEQTLETSYSKFAREMYTARDELTDALVPVIDAMLKDLSVPLLTTKITNIITSLVSGYHGDSDERGARVALTICLNADDRELIAGDLSTLCETLSDQLVINISIGSIERGSCRVEWNGGALAIRPKAALGEIRSIIRAHRDELTSPLQEKPHG